MKSELNTLDGLHADVAAEYTQTPEGTYRLNLEGPAPKGYASASDLAAANRKATGYHDSLGGFLKSAADFAGVARVPDDDPLGPVRARVAKLEGIDMEEVDELRKQAAALKQKGVKGAGDIDALLDKRMAQFEEEKLAPLTADLAAEREARLQAQTAADRAELHALVRPRLVRAGAHEGALPILLDEASKSFTFANGNVTARRGQYSPNNGSDPLQLDEWLVDVRRSHDFAFAASRGGGAGGDAETGAVPAGITILKNPTPQQLGENVDAIAAGTVVVRNSGVEAH